MDIKIVKFLDGLESSKDFLTIGKLYKVSSKGESEGSLFIYDNEMEVSNVVEQVAKLMVKAARHCADEANAGRLWK